MPELHLRQPEFTYSACGQFTKHLDRIQSFERAYEIATNPKYDEYQRGLASMFCINILIKKQDQV